MNHCLPPNNATPPTISTMPIQLIIERISFKKNIDKKETHTKLVARAGNTTDMSVNFNAMIISKAARQ